MKSQNKHDRVFSFEFFPPKTAEGKAKLKETQTQLARLNPRFFSVTYGAGGSTTTYTLDTVLDLRASGYDACPHLSCIGSSREQIGEILDLYRANGIRHVVALRGDIPSGMRNIGDFAYANELVTFIRESTGDHFHIEVAAYPEFHPEAESANADLEHFRRKIEAGANSAITQYFYNPDAYFRFVDSCESMGVDVPVVPGIMPITNFSQLARFSDACGAEIPRWLRRRLESFGDDLTSLRSFGVDVVTRMCATLLEAGCPGLHFYTMNLHGPTTAIWNNLGLHPERDVSSLVGQAQPQ